MSEWLTYYFASSPSSAKRFLNNGIRANVLLSYIHLKNEKKAEIAHQIVAGIKKQGGKVMLDSGAFSNHQNPGTVAIESYDEYLKSHAAMWDEYVTFDDLGSRENTIKQHEWLLNRGHKPLFVDHVRFRDDPRVHKYWKADAKVCMASWGKLPSSSQDNKELAFEVNVADTLKNRAELGRKVKTKTHLLAISSLMKFLPHLDVVNSVDSAAWKRGASYGLVVFCTSKNVGGVELPHLAYYDIPIRNSVKRPIPKELQPELDNFLRKKWDIGDGKYDKYELFSALQIKKYVDTINKLSQQSLMASFAKAKEGLESVGKVSYTLFGGPPTAWDSEDSWMEARSGDTWIPADLTSPSLGTLNDLSLVEVHRALHEKTDLLDVDMQREAAVANLAIHQELVYRGLDTSEDDGALDAVSYKAASVQELTSEDLESMGLFDEVTYVSKIVAPEDLAKEDQRIVFGIVLEPDTVDAQGDTIGPEEIEQAAHKWLAKFQDRGYMHRRIVNGKVEIFESYLSPVAFSIGGQKVKKGAWLLMYHIKDDELWNQVKSGEITGFSMGGFARRTDP